MQLVIGAGVNPEDQISVVYAGGDLRLKAAVDAQCQLGTINIGYVFENPMPTLTLRNGPAVPETTAVPSALHAGRL